MSRDDWETVDRYFAELLIPADPLLEEALEANAAAGLPEHDVSPAQGKLLYLLARLQGARHVLEIGTLGGYSTIWLARAVPEDGRVVTLEADAHHAEVARTNLARAELDERVVLMEGPALGSLDELVRRDTERFDLVFIDADKPNNPRYLERALALTRPGSVIVADNVVRDGAIVDAESEDPRVRGVRAFTEALAGDPRVEATAIQTVGSKGWDGFVLARVVDA